MTTRHPEYKEALPGYGSFKLADGKDAKRRRPSVSLEGFARARGLTWVGTLNPNGFLGVVPGDSRLQFNVVRGALAGGRHGILYHEVLAVPYDSGSGRAAEALVGNTAFKPKLGLRDALAFVPGIGGAIDAATAAVDKRPAAVGVPVTVGAAAVPEVATVPGFECRPGAAPTATSAPPPDPAFLERLMATSFGDVLRRLAGRAYATVRVDHAQLSIRVDGWLHDPDELDALGRAVSDAAGGLAEAAAPEHAPQPFDLPLAGVEWTDRPVLAAPERRPSPPARWLPWLRAFAEQRGQVAEDPLAYHRAFPRLPVPGTAFAVLRGPIGGTGVTGRMAWHAEISIATHNVGCNAVLLPAAPGAQPTEIVALLDLGLRHAVRDDLFCVWTLRRWKTQEEGPGDMDGLAEHAVRLAREHGHLA